MGDASGCLVCAEPQSTASTVHVQLRRLAAQQFVGDFVESRPVESQSVNRVPILRLGGMVFECLESRGREVGKTCGSLNEVEAERPLHLDDGFPELLAASHSSQHTCVLQVTFNIYKPHPSDVALVFVADNNLFGGALT